MSVIPELIDFGGPWNLLPPGIHSASFSEIETVFAFNSHRSRLFEGFRRACIHLRHAGCRLLYLDGSFVSNKELPGDYDVCWVSNGIKIDLLDPVFTNYDDTAPQKAKYGGEFFVTLHQPFAGTFFLEYFQKDKQTDKKKGILSVSLTAPIL